MWRKDGVSPFAQRTLPFWWRVLTPQRPPRMTRSSHSRRSLAALRIFKVTSRLLPSARAFADAWSGEHGLFSLEKHRPRRELSFLSRGRLACQFNLDGCLKVLEGIRKLQSSNLPFCSPWAAGWILFGFTIHPQVVKSYCFVDIPFLTIKSL